MPGRSNNDILNEIFETTLDKVLWYNSGGELICIELRSASATCEAYTTMSTERSSFRKWVRGAGVSDFTIDTSKTKVFYATKRSTDDGFSVPS